MKQEKSIGLFGAITFIVGCVIGAGVFVMTGPLAGNVGPGLYLAYILALVPAIGMGLIYSQLGSAIPTTSGQYTYLSRMIHPFVGFSTAWISLVTGASIMATIVFGFAEYASVFFSGSVSHVLLASVCLIAFTLLHIKGIKSAEMFQNAMVVFLVVVIAIFVFGGIPAVKPELTKPLFPKGKAILFTTAASLFFSYLGFNTVADIGEEVKDPGRVIPLSIFISAGIVGFLYIGTAYVLPRIIPWQTLATQETSMVEAARIFLPSWGPTLILWAGIFAIISTVNASVMMNSRLWYAMARDGWLPKALLKTNKNGSPYVAILVSYAVAQLIILTDLGVVYFGTMGSVVVLIATAILSFAPLMLPKRFPEEHAKAVFKLPKWANVLLAVVTVSICIALVISTVKDFMSVWLVIGAWLVPGIIIYVNVTKKKAESKGTESV